MNIEYATLTDLDYLIENDSHISKSQIKKKIQDKYILIVKEEENSIWFLRFWLFWDEIPIMNMLLIDKVYRWKWIWKKLVTYWENEMKKQWFSQVITSTQENENAQYFYRKIWYIDIWNFQIPDDEANEILLYKKITK